MDPRPIRKSTVVIVSLLIVLAIVTTPTTIYVPSVAQATSANNTSPYPTSGAPSNTVSAQKLGKTTQTTSHLQAKNIQESVYKCAAGRKGVIISPGNFKISADKKSGKWSGIILIKGSTGDKTGHIHSGTGTGISVTFVGNLDTRNTLCHFPGLQFAGTGFQTGIFTCGTVKTVKYTEASTGNTNTFKVSTTCN
jgi:hypothetical protein